MGKLQWYEIEGDQFLTFMGDEKCPFSSMFKGKLNSGVN